LYLYSDGEQKSIAVLNKMNSATGVAIVDGYIYYNSGYKTKVSNMGNIIYDYTVGKPRADKIN